MDPPAAVAGLGAAAAWDAGRPQGRSRSQRTTPLPALAGGLAVPPPCRRQQPDLGPGRSAAGAAAAAGATGVFGPGVEREHGGGGGRRGGCPLVRAEHAEPCQQQLTAEGESTAPCLPREGTRDALDGRRRRVLLVLPIEAPPSPFALQLEGGQRAQQQAAGGRPAASAGEQLRAALQELKSLVVEEQQLSSEYEFTLFRKIMYPDQASTIIKAHYPALPQDMRASLQSIIVVMDLPVAGDNPPWPRP